MKKFRFRQFQVYKDALQFQKELKVLSRKRFPKEEQFCLTSQLWRALDSIILNISHTSLNEVVACLDVALSSDYIFDIEHQEYLEKAEKLASQITAFRRNLLKNPKK